MNCTEFSAHIPKFISEQMEIKEFDSFNKHIKSCPDCMDELEIHYMIQVGLERIENDSQKSFNLKKELENQFNRYHEKADIAYKKQLRLNLLFIAAELFAFSLSIIHVIELL